MSYLALSWQSRRRDLCVGDIVLIRDDSHRNDWPVGRIEETLPSRDGRVRKVKANTAQCGMHQVRSRPVSELVLLVP